MNNDELYHYVLEIEFETRLNEVNGDEPGK